jgi:hypothetical protein
MADMFPPTHQRAALLVLVAALCSREALLRRDECGDWRIEGRHGHIYATPGGSFQKPYRVRPAFQFFVLGSTPLGWTNAKKAFRFARLFNDGDHEGSFLLGRFPTSDEAAVIRHYVGVTRKREVNPDLVLRLRKSSHRKAAKAPRTPVWGPGEAMPAGSRHWQKTAVLAGR